MTRTAVRGGGHQRGHEQHDRTRVVIADDSVLLREGITRLLEESASRSPIRPRTPKTRCARSARTTRRRNNRRTNAADHTDERLRAAHLTRAEHPGTAVMVLSVT